jgi:hypothetical protein
MRSLTTTRGDVKRDLWLRLKSYRFEHLVPAQLSDHVMAVFGGPDPATRAFAGKLSRKLDWTPAFARRAIEEYRKFVYLGIVSDFIVTPPKVIDQVWHEHLLFSLPYQTFCDDVLGRRFDHHPELVSTSDQTETFRAQYEATLELYESEFNVAPPADIWGTPKFKRDGAGGEHATRKRCAARSGSSDGDTPLFLHFNGSPNTGGMSYQDMPEFGGGGGFKGGGGGTSWGGPESGSSSSDDGHSGSDSGSDSSGGDGGGSDGGGSGCSSGCGGGCGGCGGGGE